MNVVILHGWGHNGELWRSLAQKLGSNADFFDMPGFGEEPLVSPDWGVPEYANWVRNKIDKNTPTILLGHSFGGRIAAEIASKNPKWLKALILSGAPCLRRPSIAVRFKISAYKTLKHLTPAKMRQLFLSSDLKAAEQENLGLIFRNVVSYDQTKSLTNIKVPTLLIWGENDQEVPLKVAEEMQQLIKESCIKIVPNVGHNSYLQNPNLFFGYVQKFIKSL